MLECDPEVTKQHQKDYLSRLLEMKRLIEKQANHYSHMRMSFEMIIPSVLDGSYIDTDDIPEIDKVKTITVQLESHVDQTIHSLVFPDGRTLSWQVFVYFIESLEELGDFFIQLEQKLCQYE